CASAGDSQFDYW
nr:immunoglobulin heavy chain junction region [Macaca mulatta]MOY21124.1 immunoglobulin heavy chain junction region [Macaca mulatta]MOY21133.1 immunoglobulin heavy chain junction region [Macaca mulatta]MOY21315.1 immunoglobulin heavy chain junction region [Macaca mulatta]MOY21321.1 immunoglobulin heavy chain junction region [Macaca mulatta]